MNIRLKVCNELCLGWVIIAVYVYIQINKNERTMAWLVIVLCDNCLCIYLVYTVRIR